MIEEKAGFGHGVGRWGQTGDGERVAAAAEAAPEQGAYCNKGMYLCNLITVRKTAIKLPLVEQLLRASGKMHNIKTGTRAWIIVVEVCQFEVLVPIGMFGYCAPTTKYFRKYE